MYPEVSESVAPEKQGSTSSFNPFDECHDQSSMRSAALFLDAEEMKASVRRSLTSVSYVETDHYHSTGLFQRIALHSVFENVTLGVIAANAIWIAIDTDLNSADALINAHPVFQIAEHMFCFFFSFEWFVRFMAFKNKCAGFQDLWFVFDTALVFMMVVETWVLTSFMIVSGSSAGGGLGNVSVLRLIRLLRLSRMARVLRQMPELMILVKGMAASLRSTFFVLVLLVLIMYVFGIAFTQLTSGTEAGDMYFASIADSMYTLLVTGSWREPPLCGPDITLLCRNINDRVHTSPRHILGRPEGRH